MHAPEPRTGALASDPPALSASLGRWEVFALAILLTVALFLRMRGLFFYWPNPDEGMTFAWAHSEDIWATIGADSHPPLFLLLLKALVTCGLDSVPVLRLPSLFAGVGTVYLVYRFGRELGGPVSGCVGACLATLSPSLTEHSQLIRPYAVLVFALTGGGWFLARTLRTRSSRNVAGFVGFSLIAVLTHFSALLVVGVQGLLLLHDAVRGPAAREEWRRLWIGAAVLGAVMAALVLAHVLPMLSSDWHKGAQTGWLEPYLSQGVGATFLNTLGALRYVVGAPVALPALVLLVAAGVYGLRRKQPLIWAFPLGLLGVHLLASAMGQYPMGCLRHSLFWAAFVYPLFGVAVVGACKSRRFGIALGVGLVVAFSLRSVEGLPQLRPASEFVADRSSVEQAVSLIPRGAIVVMNEQTYHLLAPYRSEWSGVRPLEEGEEWRTFSWGERTVVASRYWNTLDGGAPGRWESVDAPAAMAASASSDRPVWVLNGGWQVVPIMALLKLDAASPVAERRLVYPVHLGNGIQALQVRIQPLARRGDR